MKKHILIIRAKAEKYKILIKNFSYLTTLQLFNILTPIIIYPYLIRVVGAERYGLVIFAQSIIDYLAILVNFGFNISATKQISIYRDDKEKLNEIVSSILTIKGLLLVISFLIIGVILIFTNKNHNNELLFILSMWVCIYDVIFPTWYFQGIEQMKFITFLTLVSRLIFFGLTFIFIHTPSDYLIIPTINGLGALIAGTISLYIIFSRHDIKFQFQSYQKLKYYLTDSISIFISNISTKLYVSANKILVGGTLGMVDVAYYDLAEKLSNVFKIPQAILSQSLLPKISKEKNKVLVRKLSIPAISVNIIMTVLVFFFSKYIIFALGGKEMLLSQPVVNILIITVPIVGMSSIFGFQLLIPFGYDKLFSRVYIISAGIYIIITAITWLTIGFSSIKIALINLFIEIFVTIYMFYFCKKLKLWT